MLNWNDPVALSNLNRKATSLTLEQYWEQVANSNKEGDTNTIDKKEEVFLQNSVFFVYEGMTKEEFLRINKPIDDTQTKFVNGMAIFGEKHETLYAAVSRVVNQIIDNGEFEGKKDVVIGKITYCDTDTRNRVLDLLTPEERTKAEERIAKVDAMRSKPLENNPEED